MKVKRNLVYWLFFLYYLILMTFLILKAGESRGGYHDFITPVIPVENYVYEKIILSLVCYPLIGLIGIALGYLFAPFFFVIHVKLFGKHLTYGIQEYESSYPDKMLTKALFPMLMAIFLALFFASNDILIEIFVYPSQQDVNSPMRTFYPVFLVNLIWTIPLSIGLFSVQWGFNDAGFVYHNSEKVKKGKGRVIEGRSLGSTYRALLKGYAGIGAIYAYYEFIFYLTDAYSSVQGFLIPFILTDLLMPIYLSVTSIPALILYDKLRKYNIKILRKIGKKLNVFEYWNITYEIVDVPSKKSE